MFSARNARPLGLVVGFVLDRAFGDPRRGHPVAGMGRLAGLLERLVYRDNRSAGVMFTIGSVSAVIALVAPTRRGGPTVEFAATAAATWAVLGGTTLARVGEQVADAVEADDVDAARALIPSLCGRDPQSLDQTGLVRAALESVAENTSDATVAPLWWGAMAGPAGLIGYRMINTLDAMVGYRSPRYLRFGWASARLDDVANYVPARLTGAVVVASGPDRGGAVRAWRADAAAHPSPNAGVVEASFAGALGVGLGGPTVYPHRVEQRPRLGDGRAPEVSDLRAAVSMSRRVQTVSAGGAALIALLASRCRVQSGGRRGQRPQSP
ncbi:cobalamin biosynthesis protein [Williamsia sp. CHRR-6]|nr:cobalamin biosynthesis protein [Williamsia sp. CHRR-6]MBT0565344.1 cobalamin biosynthesis protein [Williamsia sp. CHRR-6]